MSYSQVTISAKNKGETREFWFVFQTDHTSLAQQIAALKADGGLMGVRHDTSPWDGGRKIVASYEYYVGQGAIVAVSELKVPLFSAEGEKLL